MNLPVLDRRSAVPIYYQIQQHLLGQIRSGKLKAGAPVPSEQEISSRLRISRMTARQALKSLCDLGVTYSQRGKGTFVSGIKLEKNFRQVLSFSQETQAGGSRPASKVLSFEVTTADDDVTEALRLSPGEQVISLRRVRMAGSSAMGIEWSRIPQKLCPDLLQTFKPAASLYQTLMEHYGIEIAVADEVVEVGLAGPDELRLLKINKGNPIFLFTRTSYVQTGQPVEYVKSIYRGDRYRLVSRLTPPKRSITRED